MNDQDLEAKIYDLLATDKSLIEIIDNIMELIKQDREIYGIECRLEEATGAWDNSTLMSSANSISRSLAGRRRALETELQTKKDNLIKEERC